MTNAAPSPIVDNGSPYVKNQITQYLATDGAEPVFRYEAPLVLLTTQGRKSGEWRRTCLIGAPFGEEFLVVASMGGAPKHPVWYLNLEANPRVWLQVGGNAFWTTAHTATPEEKPERWDRMVELYPDYADYQTKTARDIPVVILVPDGPTSDAPAQTD
jgi:deazaflavin-dependent oxidoreductase (nitroreductase family)